MNEAIHKSLRYLLNKRRSGPLAIAHRGASAWANENTLGALLVANSLGADMWEVDVHLTRDKVCVVCHDSNLLRLTGKDIFLAEADWNTIRKILCSEEEPFLLLRMSLPLLWKWMLDFTWK